MKTIVVIDDEEDIRSFMCDTLEAENYRVIDCADYEDVLDAFEQETYIDLLVTDLLMPEKDGIELIMKIKKQAEKTKILAISGGGSLSAKQYLNYAKELGADEILQKPFEDTEFLEFVRRLS